MKVGILTMLRIKNFGSFFQAYSLKKIVSKYCDDIVFFDYKINLTANQLEIIKKEHNPFYKLLKLFYFKILLFLAMKKDAGISTFHSEALKKYLQVDRRKYRTKVDVLIIGSDEVFNCCQDGWTVGYSLELFGKNNRAKKLISYAASFGDTTIEKLNKFNKYAEIKHYLSKFDAISIRDKNSKNIVDSMLNSAVPLYSHLDPVLIGDIESENWPEFWDKNYILIYGYRMRFTKKECEMIGKIAKKINCRIFMLHAKQQLSGAFLDVKVEQVPGIFKNARYIITDTFHGIIFSIIFHKQFGYFSRINNSNKIKSLVDILKVSDRNLDSAVDLLEILDKPINYDLIDVIREKAKKETENYFSGQLKL